MNDITRTSNTLSSLLSEYLRAIGGSQDGLTFNIIMSFIQWTEDVARERRTHEPPADDGSEVDELYALLVRRGWSQQDANEIAHMRPPADDSMAPIACIRVGEDDTCEVLKLYAPGLPPGEHDLYPAASSQPPAPVLSELERAAMHFVDIVLSQRSPYITETGRHQGSGGPWAELVDAAHAQARASSETKGNAP
jgi:hypothetical protein